MTTFDNRQTEKLSKEEKENIPDCINEILEKIDASNDQNIQYAANKGLENVNTDEVPVHEQDLIDSYCLMVPTALDNQPPQSDVYDDFSSELLQEESGPVESMSIVPITENVQSGTIRILPKPTLFLEYDSQGRAVNIKKVDGRVQTSSEQGPTSLLSVSIKDNHDRAAHANVENKKITNDPTTQIFNHSNVKALEKLTSKSKKRIHKVQSKGTLKDLRMLELGIAKQHTNEKQKSTSVEDKSDKKAALDKNAKLITVAPGTKNNDKEGKQNDNDHPTQPKSGTEDKSARCCECDLKVSHAVMLKAHIESRHYKLYREMYILRQITFDEWLSRKN